MAVVKCPDCGKDVSDRANVCIHCGAPLNFSVKNGEIRIKCQYLNGSMMKANVVNSETGDVLAKIRQGEVVSFTIDRDTPVDVSFFGFKSTSGVLKYTGAHNYEINAVPGFLLTKLVLNEVTNIDTD